MRSIYYLDLTITKVRACIYETLNFYDVVTHIGGHRGKRHHGCSHGMHILQQNISLDTKIENTMLLWLQGRWMHLPIQDWTEKLNIPSLARHNNLLSGAKLHSQAFILYGPHKTTNTFISSNLKNSYHCT